MQLSNKICQLGSARLTDRQFVIMQFDGKTKTKTWIPDHMSCVARVRCGEVELKLTLTPKFLAKPLQAALLDPFLGAYNKRAAQPINWEAVKCVKIDGVTVYDPHVIARSVLTGEHSVQLVTTIESDLSQSFFAAAKGAEGSEAGMHDYTGINPGLISAAEKAVEKLLEMPTPVSRPPDPDMMRRCGKAFGAIAGKEEVASRTQILSAFLADVTVRNLCFLSFSKSIAHRVWKSRFSTMIPGHWAASEMAVALVCVSHALSCVSQVKRCSTGLCGS